MIIHGIPDNYRPSLEDLRRKLGRLFINDRRGPASQRLAVIEVLDRIVADGGAMAMAAASLAVDLRCTFAIGGWPWEAVSWSAVILELGEGLVQRTTAEEHDGH